MSDANNERAEEVPQGPFGSMQQSDELVHYEDPDNDDQPHPCGVGFAVAATNMLGVVTCPECLSALG